MKALMSDPSIIPISMRRCLSSYVARRRRVALLRRLGMACAFAMLWLLVVATLDRLVPLPTFVRLGLLILNLVVVVILLFRPVRAMLSRRFDRHAAAAQIERRDPRFVGRLETAVSQLLLPESLRASPQMVQRIVSEASALIEQKLSRPLVSMKPALGPWLVVMGVALLGLALRTNAWLDLPTLLRRELVPLARVGSVTTTRISVEPGNVDVAQGQACTIVARIARLSGTLPIIRLSNDGREFTTQPMLSDGDGKYSFTLPSVDRDWQYDVSGGDARSDVYAIRVLRRPGVVQFRVRYVYPSYMNLSPTSVVSSSGALEAPVGTQAFVDLVCTEPVESAKIVVGDQPIVARPTGEPNVYQASLGITQSGPYQIHLHSARGEEGVPPADTVIRAAPDQPPNVQWIGAPADLCIDPLDRASLRFRASDDYGVTSTQLTVQINDQPVRVIALPSSGASRQQSGEITLNCSDWDLAVGDVMNIGIEVSDATHQIGRSELIHLLIAPTSTKVDGLNCAAELDQASALAQSLAAEFPEVLRGDELLDSAKGAGVFGRNTHLARSQGLADQLAAHLLRAAARNHRDDLATWLAESLDRAVSCNACIRDAIAADDLSDPEARRQAISRADQLARLLKYNMQVVAPGVRARSIRLDLLNLQALLDRANLLDPPSDQALRRALQLAGRKLDDQLATLGIDPNDDRLMDLLQEKISAANSVIESARPIDWASAVKEASAAETAQRLLWASRVSGLQPNANYAYARDLSLAAGVFRKSPGEARGAFRDSLASMMTRLDAVEPVRQAMRARADENPELAAFSAAAAIRPMPVDRPTTQPAQLSQRQQQLIAEIASIGAKSDPLEIIGPDAAHVFARLQDASARCMMFPVDSAISWLTESTIERSPLNAARFYADLASRSLSEQKPDAGRIIAMQRRAIDAARFAALAAAKYQAALRIASAPEIARLLDDSVAGDTAVVSESPTIPAPTTHEENPTAGAAPGGGYDEPLRLYFQMLKKGK